MSGDRDELGRFRKGHTIPSPRPGRPARADIKSMLIAVAEKAYTPDEIVEMLHETYETSKDRNDWKGMMDVIRFVVHYAVGKPVQRTLTAQIDPSTIKRFFEGSGEDEDEDDSDVIDVTTGE